SRVGPSAGGAVAQGVRSMVARFPTDSLDTRRCHLQGTVDASHCGELSHSASMCLLAALVGAAAPAAAQCPDGSLAPCARFDRPPIPKNSVAVLTFDNNSASREGGTLEQGLADEIATRLAQVSRLLVTSRAVVRRLRGVETMPVSRLRRELDAAYLVTGSVQRNGARFRVNVGLLNTSSARQVWGQLFDDRRQEDLLEVQGEIATAVASAIIGHLLPLERIGLSSGSADPAQGQHLFDVDTTLTVSVTTDLTNLIKKRDTLVDQPAL